MSGIARLTVFMMIAGVGITLWHVGGVSGDILGLAVQNPDDHVEIPAKFHQAALIRDWLICLGVAVLVVLGIVMFWDDLERWWRPENANSVERTKTIAGDVETQEEDAKRP